MSADELCRRVYDDVRTMLYRPYQDRREGVVNNEQYAMPVCHLCYRIEVSHIRVGVAECLGIYNLCLWAYGSLESLEVVHSHYCVADTLCRKCVCDEVE